MAITMQQLMDHFSLELMAGQAGLGKSLRVADIKRPGIELAGYWEHFTPERIQLLGRTEVTFLSELPLEERTRRLAYFFNYPLPGVIITRNLDPPAPMTEMAERSRVPLLRVRTSTTRFLSQLSDYLERELAPIQVVHAVLVEVYGIGILLTGESGIGKSEVALELVKRGHRLVADDLVEVRLIGATTLMGRALKMNQHYMEIRGLGIIDVKTLFGAGAIKIEQEIHLMIELKMWQMIAEAEYDRLGLHMQTTKLLDLQIPKVLIPVQSGRNLATVIEVAAMNHRLQYMGLHAAQEFVLQLDAEIARKKERNPRNHWKVNEDGSKMQDHSFGHSADEWSDDDDRS